MVYIGIFLTYFHANAAHSVKKSQSRIGSLISINNVCAVLQCTLSTLLTLYNFSFNNHKFNLIKIVD